MLFGRHSMLLPFEFAHMLVFIVALCLIFFIPVALSILGQTSRNWDRWDKQSPEQLLERLCKPGPPDAGCVQAAQHHIAM